MHYRFGCILTKTTKVFLQERGYYLDLSVSSSFYLLHITCICCNAINNNNPYRYGDPFINETYLYHITRRDHRHNFSLYFYYIYLTYHKEVGQLVRIGTFLPQFVVVFWVGWKYAKKDLIYTVFLQTWAFVMFNKVCTSQVSYIYAK